MKLGKKVQSNSFYAALRTNSENFKVMSVDVKGC